MKCGYEGNLSEKTLVNNYQDEEKAENGNDETSESIDQFISF